MAFDPSMYKPPEPKPLPVVLLLDVSGSMKGSPIEYLNQALKNMIDALSEEAQKEVVIQVAIITFGREVLLHTPYTSVLKLKKTGIPPLEAYGETPMGTALRMAKAMIEDRDATPSRAYRPMVILMSDGEPFPDDGWEEAMKSFIEDGRSAKCQRFGIPVGSRANRDIIRRFAGCDENVFEAENAEAIVSAFKMVTMSVSMRSRMDKAGPAPQGNTAAHGKEAAAPVNAVDDEDDEDDEPFF